MNVTSIRFQQTNSDESSKVKAVLSAAINDEIVIQDIKIIEGVKGLYVAMPSRYDKESGKRFNFVHPINEAVKEDLNEQILNVYYEWLEDNKESENTDEKAVVNE